MKENFGWWLVGLWAILFFLVPWDAGETMVGTAIGKAIATFGISVFIWMPVVGVILAMRRYRRKTH